jgi:quinol monooxygenase YgiN
VGGEVGCTLRILGALALASSLSEHAVAEQTQGQYVRLAELEVDPAQLETFTAAIAEEMETAVRVEPGCLALYAVSEKDNPAHIRVFEIYASEDAYKTHVETPQFKKFRATTNEIVKSRKLVETTPIALSAKAK